MKPNKTTIAVLTIVLVSGLFLFQEPIFAPPTEPPTEESTSEPPTTAPPTNPPTTEPPTTAPPTEPPSGDNLVGDLSKWNQGWYHASTDYSVTHSGSPTLKCSAGDYPPSGGGFNILELNYAWIPVSPGDHVVFTAWIKIDDTVENWGDGAFIGFDLYGSSQRLWEISDHASGNDQNNLNTPKDWNYNLVHWGSDWTKLTVDFVIPTTTFYVDDYGDTRTPPQQVTGIIPWMNPEWRLLNGVYLDFYSYEPPCPGNCWFADMELYIN